MNKITLIGNLTADPELRKTNSGTYVCVFTIAVNRRNNKDKTDYFRINAWKTLGETCAKYLAKGRKVSVLGELQISQYEGKNGKQTSVDVQADEVEFLTPAQTQSEKKPTDGWEDVSIDDLPF